MLSSTIRKKSVQTGSGTKVLVIGALAAILFSTHTTAQNGQPYDLEAKIDAVSAELDTLSSVVNEQLASTVPVEVSVDCSAGESLATVLTDHQNGLAPLTVNITGQCNELVFVLRNKVTLQGVSPDAGVSFGSPVYGAITVSRAAKDVVIDSLNINGLGTGLGILVARSSYATITASHISQSNVGLLLLDGSHVDISGVTLDTSVTGIVSARNSTVNVSNTSILPTNSGVAASASGVVNLGTLDPSGAATNGVTISGGVIGASAQQGGSLLLSGAQISDANIGIYLTSMASATVGNTTLSNHNNGVNALKNTSVLLTAGNVFSNNAIAVSCHSDTSYQVGGPPGTLPGEMIGNGTDVTPSCSPF